jgi:hypothetical protein
LQSLPIGVRLLQLAEGALLRWFEETSQTYRLSILISVAQQVLIYALLLLLIQLSLLLIPSPLRGDRVSDAAEEICEEATHVRA